MDSIIQKHKDICFICGRNASADFCGLEEHHVFEGRGRRNISEKYGLKVYICGNRCHRNGENSVHKNNEINRALKKVVQKRAMKHYGWTTEQFIEKIGKNYID